MDLLFISPGMPIPPNVAVVITTDEESRKIDFRRDGILIADKPQSTLDKAVSLLFGREFDRIIIGIDPGKFVGLAVPGNDKTISVHHVSVGEIFPLVQRISREHPNKKITVRIGHGKTHPLTAY